MTRRIRSYESDALIVDYDVKRCIHAAECVRGLPSVFDPTRRPWIEPSGAPAAALVRVIEQCPTGALRYRRKDGGPEEEPPGTNTAEICADGPMYLSGRLRLTLASGEVVEETRMALCRCGGSSDKPFCDNSHGQEGFSDPGVIVENRLKEGGEVETGVLEISLAKNGPILIRGQLELRSVDGAIQRGNKGALCRCGLSAGKPFCDGTHAEGGFVAD